MFDQLLAGVFSWTLQNIYWIVPVGICLSALGGMAGASRRGSSDEDHKLREAKRKLSKARAEGIKSDAVNGGFVP